MALLRPSLETVRQRMRAMPDAKLWSVCEQRWERGAATAEADKILADPIHAAWRQAAQEMARLASTVATRDIVETVLAMYLLQYQSPALFRSEIAFRAQLVRRVRCLSRENFKAGHGAADGRGRTVLAELTPKVMRAFARWLVEIFGPAGVRVAQLEKRDAEREREERREFQLALQGLT